MKKVFIGLAALAAMGVSALFFTGNGSSEFLSADVKALSQSEVLYFCAKFHYGCCIYEFDDETIVLKGFVRDDITTEFLHEYDHESDEIKD